MKFNINVRLKFEIALPNAWESNDEKLQSLGRLRGCFSAKPKNNPLNFHKNLQNSVIGSNAKQSIFKE